MDGIIMKRIDAPHLSDRSLHIRSTISRNDFHHGEKNRKISLLFIFVTSISGVEFGEICDADELCNATKPYKCSLEDPPPENPVTKCGCLDKATMRYNKDRQTCLVNAEERGCAEHISGGHQIHVHCTEHAICDAPPSPPDQIGTCHCDNGFIKDDPYCKLGNEAGPCTNSQDSSCFNETECSSNMECTDSACKCLTGYNLYNGRCVHTYDGACQTEADCHPDFPRCEILPEGPPGKCRCAEGQEHNGGKCLILIGQTCNPADDKCTTYSHCNETSSLCECLESYTESNDHHCKGKHGANCTLAPGTDCYDEWNLQCNNDTKACTCKNDFKVTTELKCLKDYQKECDTAAACHPDFPVCPAAPNNQCNCDEGLQYDDKSLKCGIIPGNSCTSGEGVEDRCFTYSHCNSDTQVCECDTNYAHVGDACVGNLGAACTVSTDCKADSFLVCSEDTKICSCEAEYTENDGKCKGGLDKPCIDGDNCLVGTCLPNNVCGCPDGTVAAGSKCESTYGKSCDLGCYAPFFLECDNTTNQCGCIAEKYYTPGKNSSMCLTGVGGNCVGEPDCIENAYCMSEGNSLYVCRCGNNFRPSGGLCVAGGADAMVKLPAFLTIMVPIFIAIFNVKNQ
ncbi:Prion-like-(Q/N-rich) domain-bearing protein 25 [Folsomia candida]|uniref:Prion-like-(Q/N-rich) domain-bearing protein 25 n=1 Tax=Folsomia candida TaxID=158441 RepID=A0A226CUS6_FOLCA|nr:Prion-like-(Q/N-rich) domain-bearing protein 25 [Folsomia candida]